MGVNSIRSYERFPNEAVCYRYIADIKWASGPGACLQRHKLPI